MCLAQKLSLASRLEHSNQTNNSRRWPSVPCFPCLADQTYWKLELAPFRCSVPHSPSLDPGWNKASGRRVSQVRLRGYCAAYCPLMLAAHAMSFADLLLFPVYRKWPKPADHQPVRQITFGDNGFPITRNLLTITRLSYVVKFSCLFWGKKQAPDSTMPI